MTKSWSVKVDENGKWSVVHDEEPVKAACRCCCHDEYEPPIYDPKTNTLNETFVFCGCRGTCCDDAVKHGNRIETLPGPKWETPPALYKAFGEICTCDCHRIPGVKHFIACCSHAPIVEEDLEYFRAQMRRALKVEGDGECS